MGKTESIHAGHRERLRTRFLSEGLDSFNEINALELLLFYCVPRKDTNELAHRLIHYFGSYVSVLSASYDELKKVDGVSDNIATYLTLQGAAVRYYLLNRKQDGVVLKTMQECGRFLQPYFVGKQNETVFLLCLDAKCKVLCCREVSEGSVNAASVSMRKIVDAAISSNATTVVLAHNHPSGLAVPSQDDIITTQHVAKALEAVDVILADHLVMADDEFVSMVQSNCFRPPRL